MSIEDLRAAIGGTVVAAGDASHAEAAEALLWNGRKQDRRPALIVRPASVADVIETVRFAAAKGMRISPRGGGHNFSGIAQQDGIVLDLGALNRIWIDADAKVAEVGPAATNRELAEALEAKGLAFPVGHCATVPMSGYLLGGGLGWNSGAWGFAAGSVESVDVVLVDGILRRVSADAFPDVFWAARGGGPEFFGVVVGYRVKLKPLPKAITTTVRVYPLAEIARIAAWMKAAMPLVPTHVEFTAAMITAPEPQGFKAALAIATVFADTPDEAAAIHATIAALAPAGAVDVQDQMPTPFGVLYDIIGNFFPVGHRYAVDSYWAADRSDDLVAGLAAGISAAPSARSFALATVLPPHRAPVPDMAFSMHGPVWGCLYTIWENPDEDEANLDWLRASADRFAEATLGHYVGECDLERPGRRDRCHSVPALARLRALQTLHDPSGLFRRPVPAGTLAEPRPARSLETV
jgi:FAD/FMN-containing dehydrogenase